LGLFLLGLALAGIPLAGTTNAEVLLTSGHVDVAVNYDGRGWEFGVHDDESGNEYEPDEATLVVPYSGRIVRPSSSAFDFLGVPVGGHIWVLPQNEDPDLLFLGIASEETNPALFSAWSPGDPRLPAGNFKWLRWNLVSASTPLGGHFSMFSVGSFGDPLLWMSTFDNPNDNSFFQLVGSHSHVNWAFTAAGTYELTFQVTAMLADGSMTTSDEGTFRFRVMGPSAAVPEPSSVVLAVTGVGLIAGLRLRRRRAV
jgi:surface-anchored protein